MPQFLDPLDVRDLGDGENWMLLHELRYAAISGEVFTIPAGFTTDFASVPRVFRFMFSPATGIYRRAAVLHDNLYRDTSVTVTRGRADALFLEAMERDGTGLVTRQALYRAVRMFGGSSFRPRQSQPD